MLFRSKNLGDWWQVRFEDGLEGWIRVEYGFAVPTRFEAREPAHCADKLLSIPYITLFLFYGVDIPQGESLEVKTIRFDVHERLNLSPPSSQWDG